MLQGILNIKMFVCGDRVSWIVLYIVLSSLTKDIGAQQIKSPATDFRRHRIVQPVIHHGRTKREITSTRHTEGLHHPEVTMTLNIEGEEHILDLRLNEDLVAGDHTISYQKDGKTVLHKPTIEELDICQYSGKVRGKENSWVALSTCHGVRGVIHDGKQMKYIEPAEDVNTEVGSQHFVYDHSDLTTNFHCGYDGGVTNNTEYDPELLKRHLSEQSRERSRVSRYKRDTSEDTEVRGPFNVNKQSRYVELVLVADNGEYRANGENIHTVHRQLKDVANIINSVYAPLNIFIALVGVVVWTEQDRIRLEDDGDATLTHFLTYRRETLLNEIPNDNAHLLTRKKFKDGVVGKALKGPICTYQYSGGVAANHSEVIGLVATTIAHEMGHNFGMEHDTETDCKCQDEKCIMSPSSTSITPTHWSDCSLRSLALSFERGMDYCLRNKPKRLFDSPTCGNGFVEPGEQCDCGLRPDPACAACCQPRACVLRSNATCASGECCDPLTCRPKTAGTVCRSADRECDLAEYCTGHSEFCPKDVHKMDATPCSNDQAYCVQGSCRTHTDQCRLLWGSTGSSSDVQCYNTSNIKGDKKGNCGYRRGTEREPAQYYRCASEDAMCGLLQCRHLNERLEYGMETVATLCAAFINNNGTIIVCRTAMLDMGTQDVDPGMVPDGAKCGEDKMCLKQKCVSVADVRALMARRESSVCPSNCSGHGVCNSEGHCHCDAGFAPPLCALPGPGGSIDSGPATDSSVQRNFMVAMYIIFLGILPSILLVLFLLYYSRHNVLLWWKKPRKTYVPRIFNNGNKNFKINLSISSPGSFKKLLNFKRIKKHKNIDIPKNIENDEHIYENVSDNEHDYESLKSNTDLNKNTKPLYHKVLDIFHRNPKKVTVKRFHRKINKEDIKVADSTELESVKNQNKFVSNNIQDKVETKTTKSNLIIVKTGLASTTNENIKVDVRKNVNKINIESQSLKKDVKSNKNTSKPNTVGQSLTVNGKSNKNVNKMNIENQSLKKDVKSNKNVSKPNTGGQSSTVNVKSNKDANKIKTESQSLKVDTNSNKNESKLNTGGKSNITNKNNALNTNKSNKDFIANTGLKTITNNRIKENNNIAKEEEIPKVNVKNLRNKFGQTSGPHIDIKNLPKRSDLRKVTNRKM